jgi:hypothetical protein
MPWMQPMAYASIPIHAFMPGMKTIDSNSMGRAGARPGFPGGAGRGGSPTRGVRHHFGPLKNSARRRLDRVRLGDFVPLDICDGPFEGLGFDPKLPDDAPEMPRLWKVSSQVSAKVGGALSQAWSNLVKVVLSSGQSIRSPGIYPLNQCNCQSFNNMWKTSIICRGLPWPVGRHPTRPP